MQIRWISDIVASMEYLEQIQSLDVFEYVRQFVGVSDLGDQLIVFFAEFAIILFFVLLIALFIYHYSKKNRDNTRVLAMSMISFPMSWGISRMFKMLFNTSRPFESLDIEPLIGVAALAGAFPSGHTAMIATASFILWRFNRFYAIAGLVVAIVVGMSRVVAGVHWPIDIAGGIVLGVLLGWILGRLSRKRQ